MYIGGIRKYQCIVQPHLGEVVCIVYKDIRKYQCQMGLSNILNVLFCKSFYSETYIT